MSHLTTGVSTTEVVSTQYFFDEEGIHFELYKKLKSENIPYVENAQLAMLDYLGEDCNVYDPLKAIIDQWLLQIVPAMPPMTVIGIDDVGQENSININKILETWIRKDKSYLKVVDCVFDSLIKSEGYLYEYIEHERSGNETVYYWPRSRVLPFSQVVYNGSTLEDSSVVCFWEFYTNDEFSAFAQKTYEISNEKLQEVYEHDTEGMPMPVDEFGDCIEYSDKVCLLHIFNTAKDKYFVYANGCWLNSTEDGKARKNPFHHKQAPISSIVPFRKTGLKHWISVAQRTSVLRELYKNIQRKKLNIVEKLEGWYVVSPDHIGDLWESLRIRDEHWYIVADPGSLRLETPQYQNYQYLQAESNDVLSQLADVTGWTFQALQTHKYENKSATLARAGAVTRTIEHIVRNILSSFYSRWMMQRLSNIQHLYDEKIEPLALYGIMYNTISAQDMLGSDNAFSDLFADAEIKVDTAGEETIIEIQKSDIEGAVEVHPDVDTILTNSKEQQLIMLKESMSMILQLPTKTGQPLITQESMIQLMSPLFPALDLQQFLQPQQQDDELLGQGLDMNMNSISQLSEFLGGWQQEAPQAQEFNVGGGGLGGNIESLIGGGQ